MSLMMSYGRDRLAGYAVHTVPSALQSSHQNQQEPLGSRLLHLSVTDEEIKAQRG